MFALLFVPACGGDPAPTTKPITPAPAPAPAPANKPSDSIAAAPGNAPAPAPQEPAAAKKPAGPVRIDHDMVKRLFGMEPSAPPFENPSTPEKVALGKMLFHEKGLSKTGNLSCATCHDLANYGQDGQPTSMGADGKKGTRNTPSVWNAARQFAQYWDARAATVEDQALMHALEPSGLGLADEAELVAKLQGKPELVAAFGKAFPGGAVTAENFKLAVGAFERTLVTKSKFDAYLDGDQKALSNEEKLGLKNFQEIGCIQCHMQRLVGGAMLQKMGVLKPYATEDIGRAKVTGSDADKFLFKVPSLTNVEKTGPYNHDGKTTTLEENVTTMALVQLGRQLKPEETASLVAFLKSLTGPLPKLD